MNESNPVYPHGLNRIKTIKVIREALAEFGSSNPLKAAIVMTAYFCEDEKSLLPTPVRYQNIYTTPHGVMYSGLLWTTRQAALGNADLEIKQKEDALVTTVKLEFPEMRL